MNLVRVSFLVLLVCWITGSTCASVEAEKFVPKNESLFFSTWRIKIRPIESDFFDVKVPEQTIDSNDENDKSETSVVDVFNRDKINFGDLINHDFGGVFNLFSIIKTKPWWEKSNVCVDKKEVEEIEGSDSPSNNTQTYLISLLGPFVSKTCYQTKSQFICVIKTQTKTSTKTLTISHQCCHGFKLNNDKECEKIDVEMLPLIETIQALNGSMFLQTGTDMYNVLENGNVTVFLPSDDVSQEYWKTRDDLSDLSMSDIFLSHITNGFKEVHQSESLDSLYDESSMQIKFLSINEDENSFLVNCARILKSDVLATNGIVHTIDRQLVPVTKTIMSIVKSRKNLSMLKEILENVGLSETLDSDENWTLLAPTNKAFEKLKKSNPRLMTMLKRGNNCALNVLKHHIIGHDVCTQQISLGANGVVNTMGELLKLRENITDQLDEEPEKVTYFVNEKVEIVENDLVATNGVVHIVDEVIVPESVTSISAMLLKHNLTMFHQLLKLTNLLNKLDQFDNITIIAPSNKALKHYLLKHNDDFDLNKSHEKLEDIIKIPTEFKSIIFNHIIDGAEASIDFENNEIKQSLGIEILRINLYSTMPMFPNVYNRATINCAKLINFDIQQCGNIMHVVDRVMTSTTGSMLDLVKNTPELSMLHGLLSGTEMEEILKSGENLTFVAPTNKAFAKLKDGDYELLKLEKVQIDRLLKQHVLEGVTCTAGLTNIPWPFDEKLKSLNGKMLSMGVNMIGGSPLISTNHMARNGVIHRTDTLMMPTIVKRFKSVKNPNVDISLVNY